jgi:hypothetical protein
MNYDHQNSPPSEKKLHMVLNQQKFEAIRSTAVVDLPVPYSSPATTLQLDKMLAKIL